MDQQNHFEFVLLRRRFVDESGRAVNEDGDDPIEWARADALSDVDVPPDIIHVGRGRMIVLSADERAFVAERLALEPEPQARYIRAEVLMDAADRPPAMQDLVATLLPGDTAVLFEVVISWADLDAAMEGSEQSDATTLVSLPTGHVILRRAPDLPVVSTVAGEEPRADLDAGGVHAEH